MTDNALLVHQRKLKLCTKCESMISPVVVGKPVMSEILLVGQAPGDKEGALDRPFAWTAGKTLFKWFAQIGVLEEQFRDRVYMSAVCRCFPGKNPKGGDRIPTSLEIDTCSQWLNTEIEILQPKLLIPVGKLAISRYLDVKKLIDVIGKEYPQVINGRSLDVIPLPHPSGASTWYRMHPGKTLLANALTLIAKNATWQKLQQSPPRY